MGEYRGCELPEDLYYDLDYAWARPEADDTYRLGVTDPAQTMAGRVQYIFFMKPRTHRVAGKAVARLESGKWVGGIPIPFDGTVVRINPEVDMLPRFTGNPIRTGAVAWAQFTLAHLGAPGMVGRFWLGYPTMAAAGGATAWAALALSTARVWPVLWPRRSSCGVPDPPTP